MRKVIVFTDNGDKILSMGRILPIMLVFFLIVPWLSPLASAGDACTEQCAVNQNHQCKHGDMCPMHKKAKAEASHEEHSISEADICHTAKQAQTVTRTQAKAKAEHCGTFIKCDKNTDPTGISAPVVEADYVTVYSEFRTAEIAEKFFFKTALNYTDPPSISFDRPPADI